MVSFIVVFIISIFIGVFCATRKDCDIVDGVISGIGAFLAGVITALLVGALFPLQPMNVTDYDVYYAGEELYYLNDKDQIVPLDEAYLVIIDEKVDNIKFRKITYDQTYVVKSDNYRIIFPKIKELQK